VRRLAVPLLDERECGASTDRVLAHSFLSSDARVRLAPADTPATVEKEKLVELIRRPLVSAPGCFSTAPFAQC
jgi:hypothetical protein